MISEDLKYKHWHNRMCGGIDYASQKEFFRAEFKIICIRVALKHNYKLQLQNIETIKIGIPKCR